MAFTWNEILKLKEGDLLHIEARNPHNAALNQTAFATFHRVDTDKGDVWLTDVLAKDVQRSLISPEYAENFINDYILGKKTEKTERTLFN